MHEADTNQNGYLSRSEIMANLDRLGIEYDARWGRDRLDALLREGKPAREAAVNASVAPEGLTVEVIVADMVHDGRGGTFPVGAVIQVTPEQAAGLRRQGFAK